MHKEDNSELAYQLDHILIIRRSVRITLSFHDFIQNPFSEKENLAKPINNSLFILQLRRAC